MKDKDKKKIRFRKDFLLIGISSILIIVIAILVFVNGKEDSLSPVEIDGKWGYVNKKGELVVAANYDSALEFDKGFAEIKLDGATKYINAKGEVFDVAEGFHSEKAARILVGGKYGMVDSKGNYLVEPIYDYVGTMSEGMVVVKMDDAYGYFNNKGKLVIQPQFESAKHFSEGLALVSKDGKYGYINKKGKFVIEAQFDQAQTFVDGKAEVMVDGELKYINAKGNFIEN